MTRVLIVDDHEVVRRGVRTVLEARAEFEVIGEAADGKEALQKAVEFTPDVVILDIGLPFLNGLTAAELIKNLRPETKVVGFTMFDSPGIESTARRSGFDEFVSKSAGAKALVNAVHDASRITLH